MVTRMGVRLVAAALAVAIAGTTGLSNVVANAAPPASDAVAAFEASETDTSTPATPTPTPIPTTTPTPTETPTPLIRLEDDDLRVVFSGAWRSKWAAASSGDTYRYTATKDSFAQASFEGTGVAFISHVGPSKGKASVYVDGVHAGTIDCYSPTGGIARSVWATDTLAPGPHTIKVVALGSKSASSTAAYVVVDAFAMPKPAGSRILPGEFTGSVKLARTGKWSVSERTGPYGGSSWRTGAKGSTMIVRFKGTAVTWIGRLDKASGKADVLLDGKRVATVSQYATSTAENRVIHSVSGLKDAVHVLTVRALASPSVSGGGTKTDVDGFAVKGTLLQAYPPTPFSYSWRTYIVVDKSSFRLYWVKDKLLIKVYPIAHGRPYWPTPSRVWRIDSKYRTDPSSVYGPRKMRLYKQVSTSSGYRYEYTRYLIHGTNEPWVIGTQASHGCIRMYNSDVLQLWPQVPLGTMVVTRE